MPCTRITDAPRIRLSPLLLATLLHVGGDAAAAEPRYLFSGFGTLGYAVVDDPDAEYRTGTAVDGADDRGSFEVDTRLGLQFDVEASERLSATVQGLAREGGDGRPDALLEWAFLRWLPSDVLTLRAGRLALPVYALSDFREVGYANTLLRPPEDVYHQIPFRSIDGVDASAYAEFGETLLSVQLYAGQTDERISLYGGLDIEGRDAIGLNLVIENGPLRLRLSHTSARIGVDSSGLRRIRDGIVQATPFVPALTGLEAEFSGRPEKASFGAVGLSLDLGRVFLDAEYTRRRIDSWAPDVDGWYVSVGTRLGAFTPYAFASAFEGVEERRRGIELPDLAPLAPLEAALDTAFASNDQSTVGAGLRWDFAAGFALKAQLERVSSEPGGIGTSFARSAPGSPPDSAGDDGDVALGSVVIDFVF